MTTIRSTPKIKITNLDDLKSERRILRERLEIKEMEVKVHFQELRERMQPIVKLLGIFSGFKKTQQSNNEDEIQESESKKSLLRTALKIAVPVIAGRFMYKKGAKFVFKSLLGYGLKQGLDYILSKNIKEHAETFKSKHNGESTEDYVM